MRYLNAWLSDALFNSLYGALQLSQRSQIDQWEVGMSPSRMRWSWITNAHCWSQQDPYRDIPENEGVQLPLARRCCPGMFLMEAMTREKLRQDNEGADAARGTTGEGPFEKRRMGGYIIDFTELYEFQAHPVQVPDCECPITAATSVSNSEGAFTSLPCPCLHWTPTAFWNKRLNRDSFALGLPAWVFLLFLRARP